MASKLPWTGKFNINRETISETADAYTAEQAKFFMSQKIAFKAGVMPQVVWEYLKTHPHSYEIKESICQKSSESSTSEQQESKHQRDQLMSAR